MNDGERRGSYGSFQTTQQATYSMKIKISKGGNMRFIETRNAPPAIGPYTQR